MPQHLPTPADEGSSAPVQLGTVELSFADKRCQQGLLLAAGAESWRRLGAGRYGVPSQHTRGLVYVATPHACTCPDFERRQEPCKHVAAVRIHLALLAAYACLQQQG